MLLNAISGRALGKTSITGNSNATAAKVQTAVAERVFTSAASPRAPQAR